MNSGVAVIFLKSRTPMPQVATDTYQPQLSPAFLGGGLDPDAMAAVVDASLYRQRANAWPDTALKRRRVAVDTNKLKMPVFTRYFRDSLDVAGCGWI